MPSGMVNEHLERLIMDEVNKSAFSNTQSFIRIMEEGIALISNDKVACWHVECLYNEFNESYDIVLHHANSVFTKRYLSGLGMLKLPHSLKELIPNQDYANLLSFIHQFKASGNTSFTQAFQFIDKKACVLSGFELSFNHYGLFLKENERIFEPETDPIHVICDALPFGLLLRDGDNRIGYVNETFAATFFKGSGRKELLGLPLSAIVETDGFRANPGSVLIDYLSTKHEPGKKLLLESGTQGEQRSFEVFEKEIANHDGVGLGTISVFLDVTRKATLEKEFKRKQHQLEESQRIANVGSWELNFETNGFLCSKELYKLLGVETKKFFPLKRLLVSCLSPDARREVVRKYQTIINSDLTLYRNEIYIKNLHGREIILSDSGKIIRDRKGRALRLYSTVQDITETKRTNEELRSSREKLMSLLNALPDRVFVINYEGVFTEYYDNIPGVSKANASNYKGYRVSDVFSDDIAEQFNTCLQNTISTRLQQSFEYNEGEGLFERWYEVRTSLCDDYEVVFLVREITQSRKATQELIKAKQRAEESDHLKSSFLANISHEIRTPLNAMMGFSNILAEDELSNEEKEKYLGIINRNADQLTSLFSDLLDISKIESGQLKIFKEPIKINVELDKLYEQFEQYKINANKQGVELKLNLGLNDKDVTIIADETRFTQVISNLLTNALKFTDEGYVEFGYVKPSKGKIKFFVKDTGKGIPKDETESIFKRFRQSATNNVKKHGGTGLGLAISESLVTLLGGRIWVESELGKGSTFWFTLPF